MRTRPSDLHLANYPLQEIFSFVAFLWFWEKVPEVPWVYYTGNCTGTWLIYRCLSSTGGTYILAAVIKCRKTTKENQLNNSGLQMWLLFSSSTSHHVANQFRVSAWHTTTHTKDIHPADISASKDRVVTATTISLDSGVTPGHSAQGTPLSSSKYTLHCLTTTPNLLKAPWLSQAKQRSGWEQPVAECHRWDRCKLSARLVRSWLRSYAASSVGSRRWWNIMGKWCQND